MGKALKSNSTSANKVIVVKNTDTEKEVLTQSKRPDPEFKDKVAIIGESGLLLKSEQVFVCPEPGCGALFALEKSLNMHIMTGHLDRHIKCEFCGSTFKSVEEKTNHLTNFHPNLEENPDANRLECQKCRKLCTSRFTLNRHIRRCHPDEIFNCPHCNREYRRKEAMMHHIRHKHFPEEEGTPKPSYPCELCNTYFHCPGDRRRHYKKAHRSNNDKRYKCVICDTIYYSRAVYRFHMRIHTSGKAFTCDICNVSFMTKAKLVRHEGSGMHKQMLRNKMRFRWKPKEVDGEVFTCDICDSSYTTKAKLARHEASQKHKQLLRVRKRLRAKPEEVDRKPVIEEVPRKSLQELKEMDPEELYDFCWERVPKVILFKLQPVNVNRTQARNERDLSHFVADEEKRFYFDLRCVNCKAEFENKDVLNSHEKNCATGKPEVIKGPHECEQCGKIFQQHCELTKHRATHSDARPFKCNYCDSAFKIKETQMAHEKHVHFGFAHKKSDRVFTCNYKKCGKKYTKHEALRKHVRSTHLGIRLKCPEEGCRRSFKWEGNLRQHKILEHAKESKDQVVIECKPCMRTFQRVELYKAHSKKARHIWKMKVFREAGGVAEPEEEEEQE